MFHGFWPRTWLPELYQLNSKLWLTFLSRLDPGYFEPSKAFKFVKRLEPVWVNYDVKLDSR